MPMPSGPGTLAPALEAFKAAQGFTDAQLAHWLGLTPAALPALAATVAPDPASPTFFDQCSAIAQTTGSDAYALRTLLRWYHYGG